jgi:hypothetical protein
MGQTEPHFLSDPMSDRKKQHGARPCVEKMQLIFFVPPNEELEGTLHPQKFGCTPKNEGKRVHVPPDEKTCGHAVIGTDYTSSCKYNYHMIMTMMAPF